MKTLFAVKTAGENDPVTFIKDALKQFWGIAVQVNKCTSKKWVVTAEGLKVYPMVELITGDDPEDIRAVLTYLQKHVADQTVLMGGAKSHQKEFIGFEVAIRPNNKTREHLQMQVCEIAQGICNRLELPEFELMVSENDGETILRGTDFSEARSLDTPWAREVENFSRMDFAGSTRFSKIAAVCHHYQRKNIRALAD